MKSPSKKNQFRKDILYTDAHVFLHKYKIIIESHSIVYNFLDEINFFICKQILEF
jgi:hypothetical protein